MKLPSFTKPPRECIFFLSVRLLIESQPLWKWSLDKVRGARAILLGQPRVLGWGQRGKQTEARALSCQGEVRLVDREEHWRRQSGRSPPTNVAQGWPCSASPLPRSQATSWPSCLHAWADRSFGAPLTFAPTKRGKMPMQLLFAPLCAIPASFCIFRW